MRASCAVAATAVIAMTAATATAQPEQPTPPHQPELPAVPEVPPATQPTPSAPTTQPAPAPPAADPTAPAATPPRTAAPAPTATAARVPEAPAPPPAPVEAVTELPPIPDGPPAMLVDVVRGASPGLSQLILVGRSGQLFAPTARGWRRTATGGVAGDVTGTARGTDGTIYVIGGRAPVYAWRDNAWHVQSLGPRYRSRAHTLTGAPILVVGRQLFSFDGDRFKRFGRVPGRVDVVWASDATKIYIANSNGVLQRGDGRTWAAIRHPLVAPEAIVRLVGVPGRALYAITDAGQILSVGATHARALVIPAGLQGLDVTAACADRNSVYIAGAVVQPDGTTRYVLATATRGILALDTELPAVSPGDQYSLCVADKSGELLIGTFAGRIRVRSADRSTWTNKALVTTPPLPRPVAAREGRGPALAN